MACWLWVAAPILGVWPGASARGAQAGWWLVASVAVLGLGVSQAPRRRTEVFGALLLGCVAVYLPHLASFGWGRQWLIESAVILGAAGLIAERGEIRWVRQAIVWLAWAQVPFMALEALGHRFWPSNGSGLTGTLGSRAALAVLLASASIISAGWRAWALGLAAMASGSYMALPALLRLVWPWVRRHRVIGGVGVVAAAWGSARWWLPRVTLRLEAWRGLAFLKHGWLNGWGFLPFPGGFEYHLPHGGQQPMGLTRDFHSALADWLGRTGLVGAFVLIVLAWWCLRKARQGAAWRRWGLVLVCWAGLAQSLEALPVLSMLALGWLMGLSDNTEAGCT